MHLTRPAVDRPSVRWSWLLVSLGLSTAFISMHQFSQARVQALRDRIGSENFHLLFGFFGIAILAGTLWTSVHWIRTRHSSGRASAGRPRLSARFLALWAGLLIVLVVAYWILVAVHSELVHLLQYLLLLLALHAAFGRLGFASSLAFLVSVFDEGYQYWVLRRGWNSYYDFNDLVLNQIGIALGVALVFSANPPAGDFRWRRGFGRAWWIPGIVALSLALCLLSGWMGIERATSPEATVFLSRSGPPPTFWTHAEWSGKDFHILAPIPGLLLTALTSLPLLFLDGWDAPRKSR